MLEKFEKFKIENPQVIFGRSASGTTNASPPPPPPGSTNPDDDGEDIK